MSSESEIQCSILANGSIGTMFVVANPPSALCPNINIRDFIDHSILCTVKIPSRSCPTAGQRVNCGPCFSLGA